MKAPETKRQAVVEDMDAFMAWLATMPISVWASSKAQGGEHPVKAAPAASTSDADFLAALKSMA
ncbi:MAG: hypothetical protein ACM3Y9_00225 [Ignavibacteria bacterium]